MSMLKVENLSVHYGMIQAVRDVSFEVNEGEVVLSVLTVLGKHLFFVPFQVCVQVLGKSNFWVRRFKRFRSKDCSSRTLKFQKAATSFQV